MNLLLTASHWAFWPMEHVVADSPIEAIGIISIVALLISGLMTAYKHLECHQDGCHRLGRFPHGHLRLCRIHHPLVPNDGKINSTHIDAITENIKVSSS